MVCRARGNQGNWFARIEAPNHPEVDGKELPCIWDYWKADDRYEDKGYNADKTKFQKLVAGLREHGFAVLRRRRKPYEDGSWEADGYIGIYKVADIEADENLRLRFVHRVCFLDQ